MHMYAKHITKSSVQHTLLEISGVFLNLQHLEIPNIHKQLLDVRVLTVTS